MGSDGTAGFPEGERKSSRFGTLDPLFDAVGIAATGESGVDGGGDRADAPGRSADVGERAGQVATAQVALGAVDGAGRLRGVSDHPWWPAW
ncbi:hypothetical protein [Rhodococcus sp. JS3073]|uniref:hypothetical protein n=1 Tax=Rhodococcus sp. JS3073 TaxID=3002901 RepID=UPI002E2270BB